MIEEGFQKFCSDFCLYKRCNGKDKLYVLLYVDDLLLCGTNTSEINQFKIVLNEDEGFRANI